MGDAIHNPGEIHLSTSSAYDIAVIGGGASGLAAAISAARAGANVLVVECDVACGLPILATGNGRCNLSNTNLEPSRYRHPDVMRAVMGEHPEGDLQRFFESVGIDTVAEDDRLYPRSKRAESVRDALLGAAGRAGVHMLLGTRLTDVHPEKDTWVLTVESPAKPQSTMSPADKTELRRRRKALVGAPVKSQAVSARRCIIATGGGSEAMTDLFDLAHLPERPVLCPIAGTLELAPRALQELDGLRIDAELTLRRDGQQIWRESGEVLFRSYGISGIAAFNMSRRIEHGDVIEMNLFGPRASETDARAKLQKRSEILAPLSPTEPQWFDGLLAPALGKLVAAASKGDIKTVAHLLTHLRFAVDGTTEQKSAQVHQGGIPFERVNLETLELDQASHVHACGEALDMDADCGGFNLAWAWLSGLKAGAAAAASCKEGF